MIQNEGEIDRLIRVVAGVIMALIGYSSDLGVWRIVFFLVGGVLLLSGLFGWSLFYKLTGISTKK